MTQPSTIVKAAEDDSVADVSAFDFRAPDKFPRGFVRDMTELHATFAQNLAERLGRELRTPVAIDQIGVEQLTYDGYVRSMPNPSILSVFELGNVAGQIIFEVSPQLGLMLVDRMLGGSGRPVAPRRPTASTATTVSGSIARRMPTRSPGPTPRDASLRDAKD